MSASADPTDLLNEALDGCGEGYIELRYHGKRTRSISVEKGRIDQARIAEHSGVGVRVLDSGTWGFASSDRLELNAIRRAVDGARAAARSSASARKERVQGLPPADLARGRFDAPGYDDLAERSLEETLQLVVNIEARTRGSSSAIESAVCGYTEVFEEKGIVTSDGAKAWSRLVRPEFRVVAIARRGSEIQRAADTVGATGAWDCLFGRKPPEAFADHAAATAVDLLSAGYPEGGRTKVLLSPALVGLLTHEAVGHTVEADFVAAGSCAAGRLGQTVASELVTLCDSGASEHLAGAGGTLQVDDEGITAGRTVIIRDGILESYLHDRESASHFGVSPTGNARAWEYDDEPLIRMRNTYIEPGHSSLDEMIASIDSGLLLDGPRNGQADANGEFMFGTAQAWPISKGKRGPLMRGVNISGIAFDVLASVDGVSSDFLWDLGSGHCGKGQPAKVDAGGPWLSCEVLVGGRKS